jgi:hypothetical protein
MINLMHWPREIDGVKVLASARLIEKWSAGIVLSAERTERTSALVELNDSHARRHVQIESPSRQVIAYPASAVNYRYVGRVSEGTDDPG